MNTIKLNTIKINKKIDKLVKDGVKLKDSIKIEAEYFAENLYNKGLLNDSNYDINLEELYNIFNDINNGVLIDTYTIL